MAEQGPGQSPGCGRLLLFAAAGAFFVFLLVAVLVTLTPSDEAENLGQAIGAGVVLGALASPFGIGLGLGLGVIKDRLQTMPELRQRSRRAAWIGAIGGTLLIFTILLLPVAFFAMLGSMPTYGGWTPFSENFTQLLGSGWAWLLILSLAGGGLPGAVVGATVSAHLIPAYRAWQARRDERPT